MDGLEEKLYAIDDLTEKEYFTDEVSERYYKDGSYYPIENEAPWAPTLYYQSSYDNAVVRISARKQWQIVDSLPYVMGQFRWGSFDYLGESNLWPTRCANFGIIDLCGFPKDHFFLYQSLWTSEPMVHILPHWTHTGRDGEAVPVVVYTNCDSVRLVLNDRSLGTQAYLGEQLLWHVVYEPGILKALAYRNGMVKASEIVRTAEQPAAIQLLADKKQLSAGERRVIHFEISIVDQNSVMVPSADNEITFRVEGPGHILGTDNGDPLDLSGYKTNSRKAFRGKCLLMVETDGSKGDLVISAESVGLESSTEIIEIRK
jgi:beta-galactosidase